MPEIHILTVAANLPLPLVDRVLTATEHGLVDLGVCKFWTVRHGQDLRVLAEMPAELGGWPLDPPTSDQDEPCGSGEGADH